MRRRGSALLQVMIAALVAGLICATVMRVRLQPAMAAAQAVRRVQDDGAGQGAINRVIQVWMQTGSCSSDTAAGVDCGGGSGCTCTCMVAALGNVVVTSQPGAGGACALSVAVP